MLLAMLPMLAAIGLCGCANPLGLRGQAFATPPNDGSVCYDRRRSFYELGQNAVSAESNRRTLGEISDFMNSQMGRAVTGAFTRSLGGGASLSSNLGPLLRNLSADVGQDSTLIRQVGASFDDLVRCRRDEVAALRRDVRNGRLSRAEAKAQADAIKQLAVADAAVARDINSRLSSRMQRFQVAISDVDTKIGSDPALAQQRRETADISRTVQTNQRALSTQATSVEASVRDTGFTVSGLVSPPPMWRDS